MAFAIENNLLSSTIIEIDFLNTLVYYYSHLKLSNAICCDYLILVIKDNYGNNYANKH